MEKGVKIMNNDYNVNLEKYLTSMKQLMLMKEKEILSIDDLMKIESSMAMKYCIKSNCIYRINYLIRFEPRGNM